ncbi:hypothetical protein [Candidatus Pelagibacter sp.]|uniref:hypothetical protein n=1 Tax=Candidatus Pelagibacter sp. TaxID=2024849 RepID=UPI003F85D7AB
MKKLLGILVLSLLMLISAHSSEDPKYLFCEANWGNDIFLKFQITNKIKYDLVEDKFVSNGKKPEPALEIHDDRNFENKNYQKFLAIFISDKYYYFSRFEPNSWFVEGLGNTIDIVINRFDLSLIQIVHKEQMLHPARSTNFNDKLLNQKFENKKGYIKQCTEIEHKQKI